MTESERKRRIERRKETLFKQAKELSVLCEVEVGIAMFSPNEGGDPIVWPSLEEARVIQGQRRLEEMDARELLGLYTLANEKMQELEKRKQDLLKLQQNVDHGGSYCFPPPAPAPDSASWFVPAMAAPPAIDGGGEGSHHVGPSSTNNGSGNNFGHQLPGFDQVWPFNFPPSF
nr:agamous-like MADS-box protein AGL90 [Ipomoea batatas]